MRPTRTQLVNFGALLILSSIHGDAEGSEPSFRRQFIHCVVTADSIQVGEMGMSVAAAPLVTDAWTITIPTRRRFPPSCMFATPEGGCWPAMTGRQKMQISVQHAGRVLWTESTDLPEILVESLRESWR